MTQQRWDSREARVAEETAALINMTPEQHIKAAAKLVCDTDGRDRAHSMALAQLHATLAVAKGGVRQ